MGDSRGERTSTGVRWRDVGAFLLITFALTWAIEITALLRGMRFDRLGAGGATLLTAVMFIPAFAAIVTRRYVTREGFASAGLRWASWKLFFAVWLGVPLLFGVVYLLSAALGLGRFDPSGEAAVRQIVELAGPEAREQLPSARTLLLVTLIATLTIGLLVTSVATFGEEFGWTGYLLPKLLPLGRWRAALLYGAIWGVWHAPVIYGGYNYPGAPVLGVGMMILFTMTLALIQTSLWLRSGSVLLTSFFHAAVNSQGRGIWPLIVVGVSPFVGGILGWVGLVVLALAGTALLATAPRSAEAALMERLAAAPPSPRSPQRI